MNGVLVLDKPGGPTSFDMVAQVRRAARERRVGHAGTLDPMATGVLVVCLGEATKLVPFLMDADKEYRATALLGVSTDTDDAGANHRVLATATPAALSQITPAAVQTTLASLVGSIVQRPPRFSALKIDGQRLYERAYAQRDATTPTDPANAATPADSADAAAPADSAPTAAPADADLEQQLTDKQRPVQVYSIDIEDLALPHVTFRVRCGKGTYIRALARDLGDRLGVGAHLTALRRLRSGRFSIADATPLLPGPPAALGAPLQLFSLPQALGHLPSVSLPDPLAARLRLGQRLGAADLPPPAPDALPYLVALDPRGHLIAVLAVATSPDGPRWSIARGFAPAKP